MSRVKRKQYDDDVKETYIWLSCTLAVVTSAVRGTMRSPVVDVRCSLYPKTHPLGMTISPPCICIDARTKVLLLSPWMIYAIHDLSLLGEYCLLQL